MLKGFTERMSRVMGILIAAPFPLKSAHDIADAINLKYGTHFGTVHMAGSLAALRKKGLITKRPIYKKHSGGQFYINPWGYVCQTYKMFWFLTRRENEVYPIKARSYFRRDQRR